MEHPSGHEIFTLIPHFRCVTLAPWPNFAQRMNSGEQVTHNVCVLSITSKQNTVDLVIFACLDF